MELFPKKVNSFQSLAIFVKNYILNVWKGFGHTFDLEETHHIFDIITIAISLLH